MASKLENITNGLKKFLCATTCLYTLFTCSSLDSSKDSSIKNKVSALEKLYNSQEVSKVDYSPLNAQRLENVLNGKERLPKLVYNEYLCSIYTNLAAKNLFGLEYHLGHGWCRGYNGDLKVREWETPRLSNYDELKYMAENGYLKPGMIVGFYHPRSKWLGIGDMRKCSIPKKAKRPSFTHNSLYIGRDKNNELFFAEQNWRYERKITLDTLKKEGFFPMIVAGADFNINPKKRK